MNKQTTISAVALTTLACAMPLQAHHSVSMFDLSAPVWLKGTVISFEAKNPHVMMELQTVDADGKAQRFNIEGPNLNRFFNLMGANERFLNAGDVVEVCGFPFKQAVQENAAANAKSLPAYHAHLMVMPDGKMRLYGPYGKLVNCVRPNDKPQLWIDFVNADPLAQQAWCNSKVYALFPTLAPKELEDEVNRRMAKPC